MKIFINTTNWSIVKQENEYPILVGNNYVDSLKVYYDSNPATQYFYPTLNILKPNDRKIGSIPFDTGSVEEPNPSTYTDDDSNTWYMFKFTLSSDMKQIDVSGKYQFTITTNYYNSSTNAITKQRGINTILSVANATTDEGNDILILGDDPGEVVASMYELVQTLNTSNSQLLIRVSALESGLSSLDSAVVHKAGAETIPGYKTFTGNNTFSGSNTFSGATTFTGNATFTKKLQVNSDDIVSLRVSKSIVGDGDYDAFMGLVYQNGQYEYVLQVWDDTDLTSEITATPWYMEFKKVGTDTEYVRIYMTEDEAKIQRLDSDGNVLVDTNLLNLLEKINTTDTYKRVYTINADGTQSTTKMGNAVIANAIIQRDANGRAKVSNPSEATDITNKNYVDSKDDLKLDKANVYNGLDKTADGFALDARQGKALKDSLDTLYNYVGYATGNDDDTTINKLREIFQFLAGEADDATLLTLLAGKQATIDSDNKLDADFVDDTNNTHKFVTAEEKQQIQTNADNIASHDTALNNRYTKTETDTLLATKQDVLTGSDSVDLTGNVASVKDKGITGDKLNLLTISNIKNLATNNCGNIHNDTAPSWLTLRSYNFNIEQGKTYLACAMFKKNANHTDSTIIATNLRYSGTTYSNYESIASNVLPITDEYKIVYRVFKANENKSNYFSAVFYRSSAWTQEYVIDIDVKSMFVCEIPDGYNYQEIMDVVKKYDYLSNLDFLSNIHEIKNNFWDNKKILCYGDSLTHGAGGDGTSYPSTLQTLLGSDYVVSNRGVGGETALQIGARQGGIQAMLQPMTIGTSNSNCEYKSIIGNTTLNPLGYQSNAENTINPVIVDGKECTISSTSSTQAVIKSNSSAFTITRPMPILTASTKDKNKTLILWVGQNGWGSNNNQDLVNIIKNMIEYNGNDKYLVIGFSTGTTTSRADLEDLMVHSFGNHYINIREYLVNYGLDDNSLTPTEQDTTDISVGTVPTSLRSDGTHLNSYGYKSVAKCVYQYGKNNNLW